MIRIRYRAPLRRKWGPSPQAIGLYDLVLVFRWWVILASLSRDRRPSPPALLGLTALLLAFRLEYVRTPTVLYLGASSASNFSLLKMMQANGPALVLAAIDHARPEVMRGRPLNRANGLVARYFQALPGYDYPQPTTLRTREGQWERTVRDLLEVVPLVVLDIQIPAPHVVRELEWVSSGGYACKTVLVTSGETLGPSALQSEGFCAVATDVESCLQAISRLTASRGTIPAPPADRRPQQPSPVFQAEVMAGRRSDLRSAFTALVDGEGADPNLDRDIARLFDTPDAPLTASLDRVLELVAGLARSVSLAIHVEKDGRAAGEVGHLINAAFEVRSSGPTPQASAARSLLAALVATELRVSGATGSDPILAAAAPDIVRSPRPPLREIPGRELAAAAAALDREVRSTSPPSTDLDDRLHALFAVERRTDTVGLTTSVDAAIAFARRTGLASSIYVNVDGSAWAQIGGAGPGTPWRWMTERVSLPPAKALIVEVLRPLLWRP